MMQLHEAAVFAMDAATPVALSSPDHGPRHWHDVARVGYMLNEVRVRGLGADENRIDLPVVFLFALLHDSQREYEHHDPDHGRRAAALMFLMVERGTVTLTDPQQMTLNTALEDHDRGLTHPDPTIAVCWDADRLTLPRVGTEPKQSLMSSAVVKSQFNLCLHYAMNILTDRDMPWSEIVSLYERRIDDPSRQIPA